MNVATALALVVHHAHIPVCLCNVYLPASLQLSEQDLLGLAAAGRLLMARPYGSRMNHSQGLASAMAAAQVRLQCIVILLH
jgi:hypothetical protein